MTLFEFKAWFEGFSEGLNGAPTAEQFDKIKEKVGQISAAPTNERRLTDRWVQTVPWAPPYPVSCSSPYLPYLSGGTSSQAMGPPLSTPRASNFQAGDGVAAFRELGRREAAA